MTSIYYNKCRDGFAEEKKPTENVGYTTYISIFIFHHELVVVDIRHSISLFGKIFYAKCEFSPLEPF